MVASGALLTINDALAKLMTAHYPVGQLMFMRGVFVLLPIAFLVWRAGGTRVLRVRNPKGQLLRGITVILGSFLFVTALKLMPLADAIAITFAGPLFLTAMATPLLAETVGWRRWLAVVVGFCGVVLMLRPTGAFQWVALLPLAVALLGAFRDIITRAMVGSESTLSILFVSTLMVTSSGLVTLPFGWSAPTAADLAILASAGFCLSGAHYFMIEAFRWAEAGLVSPFKYATMVWAVIFGALIWGDMPDSWMISGTLIVTGSGLYILHRETRLRRQRKRDTDAGR